MAQLDDYPDVLTTAQAAEILQVSTRTIRRMIDRGALPAFRLAGGRELRIRKADILRGLEPVTPDEDQE